MANRRFNSILDAIERVGNKLPHPASGETIEARSLLSAEGLRWMFRAFYCFGKAAG